MGVSVSVQRLNTGYAEEDKCSSTGEN